MICKKCNKYIPYEEDIFFEYYVLIDKLKKYDKNQKQYYFFKKLLLEIEELLNKNLCLCNDEKSLKEKFKLVEKKNKLINKIQKEDKKEKKEIFFYFNYKINFIKNLLEDLEMKEFLKEENKKFNLDLTKKIKIISYSELILNIKDILNQKNMEELNNLKNLDLLIIYNFENLIESDKKSDLYYFDELIKEIIEHRLINNLTTYIIYKSNFNIDKFILKINNDKLLKNYQNIIEKSVLKSLKKVKNNITFI